VSALAVARYVPVRPDGALFTPGMIGPAAQVARELLNSTSEIRVAYIEGNAFIVVAGDLDYILDLVPGFEFQLVFVGVNETGEQVASMVVDFRLQLIPVTL